jgi:hypothetical protein
VNTCITFKCPRLRHLTLSAVLACLAFSSAAEKPGRADKAKVQQAVADSGVTVQVQMGGFFNDTQRATVRSYYAPQLRAGKCPPGLAKKNNGCQPPGQARQWQLGQPLPASVVFHPVPNSVSVRIGLPPPGHEYVRVAADILLIAIGTRLVIDAIEDLSGR